MAGTAEVAAFLDLHFAESLDDISPEAIQNILRSETTALDGLRRRSVTLADTCSQLSDAATEQARQTLLALQSLESRRCDALDDLQDVSHSVVPLASTVAALMDELREVSLSRDYIQQLVQVLRWQADAREELDNQTPDGDDFCDAAVVVLQKMYSSLRCLKIEGEVHGSPSHLRTFLCEVITDLQLDVLARLKAPYKKALKALGWPAPMEALRGDGALWKRVKQLFGTSIKAQMCNVLEEDWSVPPVEPVVFEEGAGMSLPAEFQPLQLLAKPLASRFAWHFETAEAALSDKAQRPDVFCDYIITHCVEPFLQFFDDVLQPVLHSCGIYMLKAKHAFMASVFRLTVERQFHRLCYEALSTNALDTTASLIDSALAFEKRLLSEHDYAHPKLGIGACVHCLADHGLLQKGWLRIEAERLSDSVKAVTVTNGQLNTRPWAIDDQGDTEVANVVLTALHGLFERSKCVPLGELDEGLCYPLSPRRAMWSLVTKLCANVPKVALNRVCQDAALMMEQGQADHRVLCGILMTLQTIEETLVTLSGEDFFLRLKYFSMNCQELHDDLLAATSASSSEVVTDDDKAGPGLSNVMSKTIGFLDPTKLDSFIGSLDPGTKASGSLQSCVVDDVDLEAVDRAAVPLIKECSESVEAKVPAELPVQSVSSVPIEVSVDSATEEQADASDKHFVNPHAAGGGRVLAQGVGLLAGGISSWTSKHSADILANLSVDSLVNKLDQKLANEDGQDPATVVKAEEAGAEEEGSGSTDTTLCKVELVGHGQVDTTPHADSASEDAPAISALTLASDLRKCCQPGAVAAVLDKGDFFRSSHQQLASCRDQASVKFATLLSCPDLLLGYCKASQQLLLSRSFGDSDNTLAAVSPTLQPALKSLSAGLTSVKQNLSGDIQRSVWQKVADNVDTVLFREILVGFIEHASRTSRLNVLLQTLNVRSNTEAEDGEYDADTQLLSSNATGTRRISEASAKQLCVDFECVWSLFKPFSKKPQVHLRRTRFVVDAISLPLQDRRWLSACLKSSNNLDADEREGGIASQSLRLARKTFATDQFVNVSTILDAFSTSR